MGERMRLQRLLSQAGVAARRKAEDMIVAGRVTVNGKVVTELGTKVDPDNDRVSVDGEGIIAEQPFYVLLNKPKGCITAVTDDRGRPTVMDYLPNVPASVAPVGRLDFYSEGVLLLTNDGDLAARLLAPKSHVPKTYHVKIRGLIRPGALQVLRDGVRLEDGTVTQPAEVDELPAESKHSWLAITLHEGKSRQIHRMMETLGYEVTKLQRVAFANLTFHGLRVGDARELTQQELNELRETVGLDKSPVARGRWQSKREATDIPRRARTKAEDERVAALPSGDRLEPWQPWSERPMQFPKAPAPPRGGKRVAVRAAPLRDVAARDRPKRDDRKAAPPRRDDRKAAPPRRDDRNAAPRRDDRKAALTGGSRPSGSRPGSSRPPARPGAPKPAKRPQTRR